MTDTSCGARKASALLLVGAFLCGCGGAQAVPASAPPAPASAAPDQSPAGAAAPSEGVVRPTAPEAAPPPPPPPPSPVDQPGDGLALRRAARAELDRATRELDVASTSCESACRALASMDRATTHLCSLADEPDDQRRCEDAKQRLSAARARVRAACGICE
jgi:hypothetical protein